MSFSSDEVNFLVYRYLQESGKSADLDTDLSETHSFCRLCSISRLPSFRIHVRHRVAYLAEQHQWGCGAVGRSLDDAPEGAKVHRGRDQY